MSAKEHVTVTADHYSGVCVQFQSGPARRDRRLRPISRSCGLARPTDRGVAIDGYMGCGCANRCIPILCSACISKTVGFDGSACILSNCQSTCGPRRRNCSARALGTLDRPASRREANVARYILTEFWLCFWLANCGARLCVLITRSPAGGRLPPSATRRKLKAVHAAVRLSVS